MIYVFISFSERFMKSDLNTYSSAYFVSPVRLSCGIGIGGTEQFKNSQRGFHQSFTFHTIRSSVGTFESLNKHLILRSQKRVFTETCSKPVLTLNIRIMHPICLFESTFFCCQILIKCYENI